MSLVRKKAKSSFIAAILAVLMIVSAFMLGGCAKEKEIKIPETLSREQAALYMAIASICPIGENNTKKECLTFRIDGWSFDEIPDEINKYIVDYCASGNSQLMQFDDAGLEQLGLLVVNTDPDSFYTVGDRVYAEGKGAIFTFTLDKEQNTESDSIKVSFKKFISDSDTSGYDIDLKYEGGSWKFEKTSGAWNQYQFFTPDPNGEKDPQR